MGIILQVDAENHPDLFWAIRGGGSNFGIATRFRYRLHEVDAVFGGMLILPASAETISSFCRRGRGRARRADRHRQRTSTSCPPTVQHECARPTPGGRWTGSPRSRLATTRLTSSASTRTWPRRGVPPHRVRKLAQPVDPDRHQIALAQAEVARRHDARAGQEDAAGGGSL